MAAMNAEWKENLVKTLREVFAGIEELPLVLKPQSDSYRAKTTSLDELETSLRHCIDCGLHVGREKLVFGDGHSQPKVLFLGDIPSLEDDKAGKPFSGISGELLGKMIAAMRLQREEVYLANLLKCKPPADHSVTEEEVRLCGKNLHEQVKLLKPRVIVALGELTARTLARSDVSLELLRGQRLEYFGIRLFATYHPRDLLTAPEKKRGAWADLQKVMRELSQI